MSGAAPMRERVEALAALGYPSLAIEMETGFAKWTVRSYVKDWRKKLRNAGQPLPACQCSKTFGHRHSCVAPAQRELRDVPADFAEKVYRGMTRTDLRLHYRTSWNVVSRWLEATRLIPRKEPKKRRPMPVDFPQVAPTLFKRELLERYRVSYEVLKRWLDSRPEIRTKEIARPLRERGREISGIADPLYRRIERLVPLYFAPDVRADIISDLYVAVLDGTIRDAELEARGGAIISRSIRDCGVSRFAPVDSLDEEIGDDGWTRGSSLVDPAALAAFDYIFEEAQ